MLAYGSRSGWVQSSLERRNVALSWGSGTSPEAQPWAANSCRRPSRTARASPGSVWSVKYCHGVSAPHSSPMNSIGVNGEVSTRAAAILAGSARIRSPIARLPTWSWFWR